MLYADDAFQRSIISGAIYHLPFSLPFFPHRPFPIGGPLESSLSLTVSEIFNGECDAIG